MRATQYKYQKNKEEGTDRGEELAKELKKAHNEGLPAPCGPSNFNGNDDRNTFIFDLNQIVVALAQSDPALLYVLVGDGARTHTTKVGQPTTNSSKSDLVNFLLQTGNWTLKLERLALKDTLNDDEDIYEKKTEEGELIEHSTRGKTKIKTEATDPLAWHHARIDKACRIESDNEPKKKRRKKEKKEDFIPLSLSKPKLEKAVSRIPAQEMPPTQAAAAISKESDKVALLYHPYKSPEFSPIETAWLVKEMWKYSPTNKIGGLRNFLRDGFGTEINEYSKKLKELQKWGVYLAQQCRRHFLKYGVIPREQKIKRKNWVELGPPDLEPMAVALGFKNMAELLAAKPEDVVLRIKEFIYFINSVRVNGRLLSKETFIPGKLPPSIEEKGEKKETAAQKQETKLTTMQNKKDKKSEANAEKNKKSEKKRLAKGWRNRGAHSSKETAVKSL